MTLDELMRSLASDDVSDRRSAADAAMLDPELANAAAVPLLDALDDDDDEVRSLITSALEEAGRPDVDPSVFLARLSYPNDDVQYWAATLIGRYGPDAKSIAGEMRGAKAHASETVKQRIDRMLAKIE